MSTRLKDRSTAERDGHFHAFNVTDAVGAAATEAAPELSVDVLGEIARVAQLQEAVERQRLRMEATDIARQMRAVEGWTRPPRANDILTELKKPTPPVQYVVEDLAAVKSNVLLVAEAKAGKTTLIMNLVVAMVTGAKFLDRYTIAHLPADSSITYSNFELDENMAKNWLRDMGIEDDAESHRHRLYVEPWKGFPLPLPAEHVEDYLVEMLVSRKSSVWVVDPYGAAIDHDENSNDDTRAWTNAIDRIARRAGLSLVVIAAHSGSTSAGAKDVRVRGAYRLEDWMSVKWAYTHGGEVNEAPPDDLRYLSARGRDVSVPQFTLDYDAAQRWLRQTSATSNKTQNDSERWALKVHGVVAEHEKVARDRGEEPTPFKAGDILSALGISPTDSRPGGKRKMAMAGRDLAVARSWLVKEDGPRNSILFTVGPVDPAVENAKVSVFKFNTPDTNGVEE
nr:AAA family ATPase [Prescottella equi]